MFPALWHDDLVRTGERVSQMSSIALRCRGAFYSSSQPWAGLMLQRSVLESVQFLFLFIIIVLKVYFILLQSHKNQINTLLSNTIYNRSC